MSVRQATPWRLAVAASLVAVYATPLFAPPPPVALTPPAYDHGIWQRLFPGVPWWWVSMRILALALAGVAFAFAKPMLRAVDVRTKSCRTTPGDDGIATNAAYAGLTCALMLLAISLAAPHLGRTAQAVFLAVAVGVPSLFWTARARQTDLTFTPYRPTGSLLVLVIWAIFRTPYLMGSSRAADAVDGWQGLPCLTQALDPNFNLLTDSCYPAYTALPIILQGIGWFDPAGIPNGFAWLQTAHLVWIAATGLLIGACAERICGRGTSAIATAVFLFAPFIQRIPLMPSADFVFAFYAAALLLSALVAERGSPFGIVCFGLAAGMALRCPPLYLLVPMLAMQAATGLNRGRWRRASSAILASIVLALAITIPGAPTPQSIQAGLANYADGAASWTAMEAALFGLLEPASAEPIIDAVRPGPWDVAIGLLLSPFAAPRTAVRLWGDTLFDPIGAALIGIGVAVALRNAVTRNARLLLLALITTMLPGVVSSYDRASLPRVVAMSVPLSLLAAYGFRAIADLTSTRFSSDLGFKRSLADLPEKARLGGGILLSALIAIGGSYIFDVVNPAILARSPAGLAIDFAEEIVGEPQARATTDGDSRHVPNQVILMDDALWDPTYAYQIAQHLGQGKMAAWPLDGALDAIERGEPLGRKVYTWSIASEESNGTARTFCRRPDEYSVYRLRDAAGITTLMAAAHRSIEMPAEAFHVPCDQPFISSSIVVDRVLVDLDRGKVSPDSSTGIEAMRRVARQTFFHPRLFSQLAERLLTSGEEGAVHEAEFWAWKACHTSRSEAPQACGLHARALAANSRFANAAQVAERAATAADAIGNESLANELRNAAAGYRSALP